MPALDAPYRPAEARAGLTAAWLARRGIKPCCPKPAWPRDQCTDVMTFHVVVFVQVWVAGLQQSVWLRPVALALVAVPHQLGRTRQCGGEAQAVGLRK